MRFLFLTGIRRISLKIVWINIVAALAAFHASADSAFITVPLQRTGADTNATGLITINLTQNRSSMLLQVSNLTPGRAYAVGSGGLQRGTFVANRRGQAQLRFSQPVTVGTLPFNFDPRGKQIVIVDTRPVLRARISGPGEPRASVVNEQVTLPRVPGTVTGTANANYQLLTNGTRRFSVALTNLPDAVWTVYVDGIRRGDITVTGGTGTIAFDNVAATPERPLNFDPRGVVIDIARGNALRFSGKFQARANGINAAIPSVQTFSIPATGAAPGGFARARRWVDRDARREFDIELLNLPIGDYELYTNGLFLGTIPVLPSPLGTDGEIKFATNPDDEEERLLSFNALTNSYTIQRDGQVLFQGQPVIGSVEDPGAVVPERLELPLFNRGVDANGIARALFKSDDRGLRRFQVEIKNVPPGDYSLTVNGLGYATFRVGTVANVTRGLIEFEDVPEFGEFPLTFNPLGAVIGIERRGARYFERLFPANP